ncbi:putative signal transducing protein [Saccharicrinis sp. FJH62]|uniref:putative signal transducing protein n=1 Tax=Saccharicrinis sp. FJH62 TaxID=3344657 RepID=UPI0035D3D951
MKLLELFDGTLFDCQMLKNLLEKEDIESVLKDEIVGARSVGLKPGGTVKVIVADTDWPKALKIKEDYVWSQQ